MHLTDNISALWFSARGDLGAEVAAFAAFVNARPAAVDTVAAHRLCDPHSVTCCHRASAASQGSGFTYLASVQFK